MLAFVTFDLYQACLENVKILKDYYNRKIESNLGMRTPVARMWSKSVTMVICLFFQLLSFQVEHLGWGSFAPSQLRCCRSVVRSCSTLWPHELQCSRLPCPSLSCGVCSNSCPLSRWCHPIISSSVTPFSYLICQIVRSAVEGSKTGLGNIVEVLGADGSKYLTCILSNLYAGQEATVRTGHRTTDWFQIGKGVRQGLPWWLRG